MAESFKYGNGVWATKEGSSLAYNDENDNYKPLPFSVTRDSIATRVNKQGLIEVVGKDKLRIDYTDSTKGVALLEPARTNLITYSEDFSQSEWTNASYTKNGIVSYNSNSVSPDGSLGVYQFECTTSGTNSQLGALKPISSGVSYTNSVYLRRINGTGAVKLRDVNNTEKDITADLTSDWKRFETTATSSSTNGRFYISVEVSGDIIEVWGCQLEAGSYATSYIPTSGSAVPRAADVANGAGNSEVFNDSEGVLFAEVSGLSADSDTKRISISDGTSSNRVTIYLLNNAIGFVQVSAGSVNINTNFTGYDAKLSHKIIAKYKENDFALWVNGYEIFTDTSGNAYAEGVLDTLNFDDGYGGNDFYGKAKRIGYFDAVLTDAELEALTSYTSFTNMANELNLTIK